MVSRIGSDPCSSVSSVESFFGAFGVFGGFQFISGAAQRMPPAVNFNERIRRLIARIPRGRVATYGQLARLAGFPGRARQVGYALAALPGSTALPWHRVINAQGEVSRRRRPGAELTQRLLLVREGIRFDARGRVALEECQWSPRIRTRTPTR